MMQFSVYRAYRLPYHWVPQVPAPKEISVIAPDITKYRVPGSCDLGNVETVRVCVKMHEESCD